MIASYEWGITVVSPTSLFYWYSVRGENVLKTGFVWIVFYSVTGKKLMAKCRMLIQENQELGRQLSQGRVAQLEAELALQKKYSDELGGSQDGKADNTAKLATVLNWVNKNESELFYDWYTSRIWVKDVAF